MKRFSAMVIALLFLVNQIAFASHFTVRTANEACQAVIARGIKLFRLGPPARPFCDYAEDDTTPALIVVGLHSGLPCPHHQTACSNLVGWYAVQKNGHRVIRWDVANDRPGRPL